MTMLKLTSADVGAPALSGTNGTMCAVLDWALPQQGWAIEYSSGNARVYRAGSGHRHRLHVNHDSAVSGSAARVLVRGCENASDATTLIDPFPTVAQIPNANSNWLASSTVSAVERPYRIYLTEEFLLFFTDTSSLEGWSFGAFGDVPPMYPGDDWATIMFQRNTANQSVTGGGLYTQIATIPSAGNSHLFWCRDVSGAVKSSRGNFYGPGSPWGTMTNTQPARGGYQNRFYRDRPYLNCIGSSSTSPSPLALVKRAAPPNIWYPLHANSGAHTTDDTFSDVAYNPAALFCVVPAATSASAFLFVEETDTWSPA